MIEEIKVHEHGRVVLMDIMGSDHDIADAARISYGKGTKSVSDDRGLIRYLMRHWHTTPFEMVELKFALKMPIFIARQHLRHRTASVNEYSGRYSVMSDDFYLPPLDKIKPQSLTNKQGRDGTFTAAEAESVQHAMSSTFEKAHREYRHMIDPDVDATRELARIVLPVANYTEMYWKIDLHNFFHYIRLRMDGHAQEEIRDYATAMYNMVKARLPIACEAFEDYRFNAVTLSAGEVRAVDDLISGIFRDDAAYYGMGAREWREFNDKWGAAIARKRK